MGDSLFVRHTNIKAHPTMSFNYCQSISEIRYKNRQRSSILLTSRSPLHSLTVPGTALWLVYTLLLSFISQPTIRLLTLYNEKLSSCALMN